LRNSPSSFFRLAAALALVSLITLCLAWEMWLAPLRPGGSLMALKALPLVLPLAGANFFGVKYSFWAPLVTLALHVIYGVVLGGTFAWLKGYWHVHHEHHAGDWRSVSGGKVPAA